MRALGRRNFLAGLGIVLAAPAIIRPGLLMPAKTPVTMRSVHVTSCGFPTCAAPIGSTWVQDNGTHRSLWKVAADGVWSLDQPVPEPASTIPKSEEVFFEYEHLDRMFQEYRKTAQPPMDEYDRFLAKRNFRLRQALIPIEDKLKANYQVEDYVTERMAERDARFRRPYGHLPDNVPGSLGDGLYSFLRNTRPVGQTVLSSETILAAERRAEANLSLAYADRELAMRDAAFLYNDL